MSDARTFSRSFAGGEVTPEFWGRIDDIKYQTGLARCRNMIVLPHGPIANRAGFGFVREVKTSAKKTRVIPFSFSVTQTMVLEFGEGYVRYHTNGATLLVGTPDAYMATKTVSAVDTGTETLTSVAHGYADATPVRFESSTTLPPPLAATTTYYVVSAAADTLKVSTTVGGAAVNLTGAGSGIITFGRYYEAGDLVASGGTNYYCTTAHAQETPPSASFWYAIPSTVYEIPTTYTEAQLFDIHFVQSADVLTLVHPEHPPRELRRLGSTKWVLSTIAFAPVLNPPTGAPTVTATRATSPTDLVHYQYKITAVKESEESFAGTQGQTDITNNLLQSGAYNTIVWTAVTGATRYYVYRQDNGLFGYVGQTDDLTFKDDGITPDISKTPPLLRDPFTSANNYPAAVSYHLQRRVFAGTNAQPQNVWSTRTGTESNLTYSLPAREDDSLSYKIAAREVNAIRHIVPLQDMVLLTNSAEWRVETEGGLTNKASPQSYVGSNNVQPLLVNNSILYAAARGGHIREMGFNNDAGGYITGDLSLRAPHLFDQKSIVDMAYSKAPIPICWFVSSSGNLIGLTYIPEQQIGAWHRHDTQDGLFESIAVVAEGEEDVLYAVIKRTIGGVDKRYIERLHTRSFGDPDDELDLVQEDAFFVDSGLTYEGVPADVISGLDHLEGKEVSILVDGAVHPRRTVTGGSVTLDVEGSVVHVGLRILADVQTLPVAIELRSGGFAQGRVKNVNKVWLRVYRSSGIFTGPSLDMLVEAKQRTTEPWGSPPRLKTEEVEVVNKAAWTDSASVFIRQADPLPLTISSISLEVAIGG